MGKMRRVLWATFLWHLRAFASGEWLELARISHADAQSGDFFGAWGGVALSGNVLVVGAYKVDADGAEDSGAAYVFVSDDGGLSWIETAELVSPDSSADDHFGFSVALHDGVIVVGARQEGDTNVGAAYVFESDGDDRTSWSLVATLANPEGVAETYFGYAVSVSGDVIVVGAVDESGGGESDYTSSAYVFARDGAGGWALANKLASPDGDGHLFGYSVSCAGELVVVGAIHAADERGQAHLFSERESGEWTLAASISAPDAAELDWFGFAVAAGGDVVVVGACYDKDNGYASGSAYVYARVSEEADAWELRAKLVPEDGAAREFFGCSVATDGEHVVVGAYQDDGLGAAYVYAESESEWVLSAKLTASEGESNDFFGRAVSVDAGVVAVGAHLDDSALLDNIGSVSVYREGGEPSALPSPRPTHSPTHSPTTPRPTTAKPTVEPGQPTAQPHVPPTAVPTRAPTPLPSGAPTRLPFPAPTSAPSYAPTTALPFPLPTSVPSYAPTSALPVPLPTSLPSYAPTTASPFPVPTSAPLPPLTLAPTRLVVASSSQSPSYAPSTRSGEPTTALPVPFPTSAYSRAPTARATSRAVDDEPGTTAPSAQPSPAFVAVTAAASGASKKSSELSPATAGVAGLAGFLALVLLVIFGVCFYRRRKRPPFAHKHLGSELCGGGEDEVVIGSCSEPAFTPLDDELAELSAWDGGDDDYCEGGLQLSQRPVAPEHVGADSNFTFQHKASQRPAAAPAADVKLLFDEKLRGPTLSDAHSQPDDAASAVFKSASSLMESSSPPRPRSPPAASSPPRSLDSDGDEDDAHWRQSQRSSRENPERRRSRSAQPLNQDTQEQDAL